MARLKRELTASPTVTDVDVLSLIKKDINAAAGIQVAYALDDSEATPTDLNDFVSSGSSILDLAISNRAHGGFPVGRIIELIGWEGAGKSLVCAHMCADIQKKGGVAVYIDTETAMNTEFMDAIGVDRSKEKFLYINENLIEKIFGIVENVITKMREKAPTKKLLIVVDSLAAATTEVEASADFSKDGWATSKAIILSKVMRKITHLISKEKVLLVLTNQLRTKLGVTFGDATTTSGGTAVKFHASVRVQLKKTQALKNKTGELIGVETEAKVIKNRLGPPLRSVKFDIFFDRGIDDASTWLALLQEHGLVTQSGAYCTLIESPGQWPEIKFKKSDLKEKLFTDDYIKETLYDEIAARYVRKYKERTDSKALLESSDEDDGIVREDSSDE